MDVIDKVRDMHILAADVFSNGVNGSRVKAARMLGFNQMIQFDKQQTLRLDIGCWMLGLASGRAIEEQTRFIDSYVLPVPTPGEKEDENAVDDVLGKSRLSDQYKEMVRAFFVEGKTIGDFGLTGVKKQNFQKALETTKAGLLEIQGKDYPISDLIEKLRPKLTHFSPEFFIRIVTQTSGARLADLLSGKKKLNNNELATVHLATLMAKERFSEYENRLYRILSTIEKFRHEYYVIIAKLSPLLVDGSDSKKPPVWIKFFDHDSHCKAPVLAELVEVYQNTKVLSDMSADDIRAKLKVHYGENSRVRVYEFGKVKQVRDRTGQSLSEIHRKIGTTADVGQFYRAYQKWEKESSYCEYWK